MQIPTSILGLFGALFLSSSTFAQAPEQGPRGWQADQNDARFERREQRAGLRERMREHRDERGSRFEGRRGLRDSRGAQGRAGGRSDLRPEARERGGREGFWGRAEGLEGRRQMAPERGRGLEGLGRSRQGFGREGQRALQGSQRFGRDAGPDQGGELRATLEDLKAERRALKQRIQELKAQGKHRGKAEGDKPHKPRKKGKGKRGKRKQGQGGGQVPGL